MDTARCLCAPDFKGSNRACPLHGFSSPDPCLPYLLNYQDKSFLRRMRIDPEDSADIADVYRSDLKERR